MDTDDIDDPALKRLLTALTESWDPFPPDLGEDLKAELRDALAAAREAPVQILLCTDSRTRPRPLRLTVLASDYSADAMYRREWVEFAIEAGGRPYLIYRFKNGEDHAVPWSPSVSLPDGLIAECSPALATALYGDDA